MTGIAGYFVILSKIPASFRWNGTKDLFNPVFSIAPIFRSGIQESITLKGVLTPEMISFHKFAILFSK